MPPHLIHSATGVDGIYIQVSSIPLIRCEAQLSAVRLPLSGFAYRFSLIM